MIKNDDDFIKNYISNFKFLSGDKIVISNKEGVVLVDFEIKEVN